MFAAVFPVKLAGVPQELKNREQLQQQDLHVAVQKGSRNALHLFSFLP